MVHNAEHAVSFLFRSGRRSAASGLANLITASRLVLLGMVVAVIYLVTGWWQLLTVPLLILVFASDGFDGYVARKRHETSAFGAWFDISSDRVVEYVLWIVFADLDWVPLWVPLLFVIRGTVVDTIRSTESARTGQQPFDTVQLRLSRWLVGGRFMRIFYAVIKAVTFCWLALVHALVPLLPPVWRQWGGLAEGVTLGLVLLCAVLCVIRGLPVLLEFMITAEARRNGNVS